MLFISIGHSGGDVGAVANGAIEYNECEKIGQQVVQEMKAFTPTRLVDTSKKLVKRIALINAIATPEDTLIELHMDSASPSAQGATVFFYTGDSKSEKMAGELLDVYCTVSGVKKRKTLGDTQNRHGRLAIVRDTKPRSFLIELGFITNTGDLDKVRANATDALVKALSHLLNITPNIQEEQVAAWAESSFLNAEKVGFTRKNPSEIVGTTRLRKILAKSEFNIKDNNEPVTYQELVVVFDRDGRFTS